MKIEPEELAEETSRVTVRANFAVAYKGQSLVGAVSIPDNDWGREAAYRLAIARFAKQSKIPIDALERNAQVLITAGDTELFRKN